jgi:hypothetical protein
MLTPEQLAEIRLRCEAAAVPDRGELREYCPAHDYGDPGYPPENCAFCVFDRDAARSALANQALTDIPALLAHIDALTAERDALANRVRDLTLARDNALKILEVMGKAVLLYIAADDCPRARPSKALAKIYEFLSGGVPAIDDFGERGR